MAAVDGSVTRRRALVRSDTLNRLRPSGWEMLVAHGVRTVIDLRDEPHERYRVAPPVTYLSIPLLPADFPFPVSMDGGYERALDQGHSVMAAVVRAIVRAQKGAVLFHCHSGTGRTGVVALVLLALCGVRADLIDLDYRASYAEDSDPGQTPAQVVPSMLRHLDVTYGGVASYLRRAGVAEPDLDSLRKRLLTPSPVAAIEMD